MEMGLAVGVAVGPAVGEAVGLTCWCSVGGGWVAVGELLEMQLGDGVGVGAGVEFEFM